MNTAGKLTTVFFQQQLFLLSLGQLKDPVQKCCASTSPNFCTTAETFKITQWHGTIFFVTL
jgi:hypothetical protein